MGTVEESKLNEIKMLCVEGESAEAHAAHADDLAKAYAAFAGRQDGSNPASPGVTNVSADVVVASDVAPPPAG